ncbi:unnamed protein product [Leptosia nina]|uniref:Uncharacterized protein n=1 Tax=Leptosia nina TaxID=320188 RepID=A0AAV1JXJ4_9NEOP
MTETSEGSEKSELEEKVSEETSKSEMPPPSTCKHKVETCAKISLYRMREAIQPSNEIKVSHSFSPL